MASQDKADRIERIIQGQVENKRLEKLIAERKEKMEELCKKVVQIKASNAELEKKALQTSQGVVKIDQKALSYYASSPATI
jgi:hypothetical protein